MPERNEPCKEMLMNKYRNALHGVAISSTLLEMNAQMSEAEAAVRDMAAMKMISLKEETDMKATMWLFERKTTHKIIEDFE